MADQRSVMKEYRLLEQKRQAGGLSPQEEDRFAQLRDLVGSETGVGQSKPGFDVNAAAARLRESLLPAGLRNRPPPMPEAAPEPEPAATPASSGTGLEAEWSAAPFAPLTETSALSADALFDPETLGTDAPAEEPAAWDPNAQPYDPAAAAWDPNAQPYDPNAAALDPNAQPGDAGTQGWDPNATPQWDAAVQPAWDPALAAPWGDAPETAQPLDVTTELVAGEEPAAALEPQPWETEGLAGVPPEGEPTGWESAGAATEPPSAVDATAWDATAIPAEEPAAAEPEPDFLAAGTEEELPEAELEPELPSEPVPAPELELEPVSEELLPFDAAAASAIAPDAAPEGWGASGPSELEAAGAAFEEAAYGDLAGNEPTLQVDPLPSEEAQGLLAPLGEGQELTSEDDALAQGFKLESNGSFGGETGPAEPAWSATPPAEETESWESAPALDLVAMTPAGDVPPIDLDPGEVALAPEAAPFVETAAEEPSPPAIVAPPDARDALEEIDVEEIPVVDGADFLEELPPHPLPSTPPPARAAGVRVEGVHRVVVHTVEGLVKRGSITDAALDAPTLPLAPQPGAAPEQLPTSKVKAIFFMLSPGEKAPAAEGKKVRVTFTDGRQIAGFSPDYSDAGAGFFMIPADTRTNTGRIWVYRSAVKSVAVS